MGIIDRFRTGLREFVLGKAVVGAISPYYRSEGDNTFTPPEYGNYIATSNGVYTCATGRADLLVTLKPMLYRLAANGDKKEIAQGNLMSLLQKVNPYWTFNRLLRMTELSLCLWGEAYWFLERGQSGRMPPREIWWGRPDRVTVVPDPTNYIKGFLYSYQGEEIPYEPGEVIWFRFPNPLDEFQGLSPMAAARLAADYAGDAMKSNRLLFKNGNQMGGIVSPKDGVELTDEQAKEVEKSIDRRFKGADKAHKWGVFRFQVEMKEMGVNPKDAEFLGGMKWSLEDICRAYKWPLDLVGGQRTYENFNAALRAAYTHAVIPEATYIASEVTEQLLPMFPGEADLMEFDASHIDALQELASEQWKREQEQISAGCLTINEWCKDKGKDEKAWGDVWWRQGGLVPTEDATMPEPEPAPVVEEEPPTQEKEEDTERKNTPPQPSPISKNKIGEGAARGEGARVVAFGSEEHERIWRKFERRSTRWEKRFSEMTVGLFERQLESVLARLKTIAGEPRTLPTLPQPSHSLSQGERSDGGEVEPFDKKEWQKKFRVTARPVIGELVEEIGDDELDELGVELAFDVKQPEAARFIERRAQRFSKEVNETTWEQLRASLAEGIDAGEGLDALEERVKEVMQGRIDSTPETIARTEVIGAMNGGKLQAYRQSGVVKKKGWLGAMDERQRDSHTEAHNRYQAEPIDLDEDFEVGGGRGPAPGEIGLPEEDINCRCTVVPVIEEEE